MICSCVVQAMFHVLFTVVICYCVVPAMFHVLITVLQLTVCVTALGLHSS